MSTATYMRNPYLFAEVKSAVDLRRVMEDCGVKFNRLNKCICPFHTEKTASMSIKNNRWHCFGCVRGGSVIDFIMLAHNMSEIDATIYLIENYAPHIDTGGYELDKSKIEAARKAEAERQAQREQAEREKEYQDHVWFRLCAYLHWLQEQEQTELIQNHAAWCERILDRAFDGEIFKRDVFDVDMRIKGMWQQHGE